MTRRTFLEGLGAAGVGLLSGCEVSEMARFVDDSRVDVRIGVLANTAVAWIAGTKMLEKAFRYYRQMNVAAVVITGAVTQNGYKNQYEVLDQVWRKVFGATPKARLILDEGPAEVSGFAFAVSRNAPTVKGATLTFHGEWLNALTDERSFYDPDRNAVCAGSMCGVQIADGFHYGNRLSKGELVVPCAQGLLVSVYGPKVAIRRLDFTPASPVNEKPRRDEVYAEDVGSELVLDRDAPFERKPSRAPEFWDDTTIKVLPGYAGDKRIFTVQWPSVQARFTGVRAFCYEVLAHLVKPGETAPGRAFRRRNVLSSGFLLAESRDNKAVTSVFPRESFQKAIDGSSAVVVSVAPIGPFGDRGKPVFSAPFEP